MGTKLLQKNIPKGWTQETLGNLLVHEKGKLPKNLSSEKLDMDKVPYLTIKTINGGVPQYADITDGVVANKTDLLVVADGSGSGRIYRGYEGVLSSTFFRVTSKEVDRISNDFIEQLLCSLDLMQPEFRKGSTIPHLNFSLIQKISLAIPPVLEQQEIACILKTLDSEIENTKKLISKTERLKDALMVDLFTKGIGHTKFKKTEIGTLPENWDVFLVDDVAKRGSGHTPNKQHPEYWNGGIKWVSLSDSNKLDDRYVFETDKEISLEGIENSSAVLHPKDTVIICRDAGIGKVGILGADAMAVSQHFIAWQCSDKLSHTYFYYLLQSWRKKFERIATGTTIKTIGLSFFKELLIPVPGVEEQKKIGEILWLIDDKITKTNELKEKIIHLKKGLMSDLLSGKVRVK